MLYDAMAGAPLLNESYDCCILGGGPAGITLAMQLAEAGKLVLLLEGGGLDYSDASQAFYAADMLGLDCGAPDTTRLRYLGGATNHWGGMLFQLDEHDFEPRDHVELSGWPIRRADLKGYADRTAKLLGTTGFGRLRRPVDGSDVMERVDERWASDREWYDVKDNSPMNFAGQYLGTLRDAPGIHLVLNANVTGLTLDTETAAVTGAEFRTLADQRYSVRAKDFVLAMGGLENSRFLLTQNAAHGDCLGNRRSMVGRCFMEHPTVWNGSYFITKRLYSHSRYWELERLVRRQTPTLVLSPSAAHQRAAGLLNAAVHFNRMANRPLADRQVRGSEFIAGLSFGEDYFFTGETWTTGEQVPNQDSRITLSDRTDRFGLPRLALDWRLKQIDLDSLREATLEAAKTLIRSGLGRMQIDKAFLETPEDIVTGSSHHMGGTRMSETDATGVVDANCKVHGCANLYVAGSSVFATGGFANPTFTILQLALRLGDHLSAKQA
ncbi:MAG: GMC family oxidoreductase [Pseudomonadota bacterium]